MASIAKEVLSDLNQERQWIYEILIRSVPSLVNNRDPFCWLLLCPSSNKLVFLSHRIREIIRFFFLLSGCLRTLLLVCNFLFFLWTKRERENTGQFHTFWMCHFTECESESQDTHSFQEQEKGSGLSAKDQYRKQSPTYMCKAYNNISYANKSLSRAL